MKKIFLSLALLIVAFSLTACAESPGIEDSALPEDFLMRKAIENGDVEYPELEKFEIPTQDSIYPSGNYILLSNQYGTEEFILSFYKDAKKICSWEEPITMPTQFLDKSTLFVVEENCPGMGELAISWDLSQNVATVPVWSIVGNQYFLLSD